MKKYTMPTQAQINSWKKEHGTIHKLTVIVPGQDPAICIVRDPLVSDIAQSSQLGDGDEFKIGKIQLDNCWLDGDDRIKTRLAFTQAAAKKMGTIFEVYPFTVETIALTPKLIERFSLNLPEDVQSQVKSDGEVRRIAIRIGRNPILNEKGEDQREEIEAFFKHPDLQVKEKADLVDDFLGQGTVFVNECFLIGDSRFKDHTSEPIAFASYLAGHSLIENFTTEVEKL